MMRSIGIGCGVLLLLAVVGLALAIRSHRKWLAQQSPAGVWQGADEAGVPVLVAFDGGPDEGVYRELRGQPGSHTRELGHWSASGSQLRLLILATDTPDHPRFGVDTPYQLSYTGPTQITINGPDRQHVKLDQAPAGTEVPIERFEEVTPDPSLERTPPG